MPPIVLDNVTVFYGQTCALREVSLAFEENLTTAVVGASGCGKSTLLQLVNGLVRPAGGQVHVFGAAIDYGRLPELRRQIGYAVQGTGLFPHLTIERNITLLGRLNGWPPNRIQARAEELMRLVGLPADFAGRYPHQLSGGQQQRVGLCRAMMLNPSLFLLDEPFGALDPVTRNDIHREFLHLQQAEPRTMVLVTHDVREAMKLAQRIVVLDQGRLLQQGPSDQVRGNPAGEQVRLLFESQLADS